MNNIIHHARTFIAMTAIIASTFAIPQQLQAGRAEERAVEELAAQFVEVSLIFTAKGYDVHDFEPVAIKKGGRHHFTVHLDAGDRVILRGLGDSDAADLDLKVFNPRGRKVAQDIDTDATPVAQFTAHRTGRYTIVLSLPSCHDSFSFAGLLLATR